MRHRKIRPKAALKPCQAAPCTATRRWSKDMLKWWTCQSCGKHYHWGCSGATDSEGCDDCWYIKSMSTFAAEVERSK